jgi:hypothetical protein
MKIVKESIEFKRGGENPLKSLRLGKTEVLKKELKEKNFDLNTCKETLERISKKYARKRPSGKVHFTRELSEALEQIFGPDFKDSKASKQERNAHSDKSRQFFKDLLKKVKLNDSQISEDDLLESIFEFTQAITPDPLWFEAVLESFSYITERY